MSSPNVSPQGHRPHDNSLIIVFSTPKLLYLIVPRPVRMHHKQQNKQENVLHAEAANKWRMSVWHRAGHG
jgi:hypothetical protein